ncbi:MAG: ATP-binding protein [Phycisphaerae bacterium]
MTIRSKLNLSVATLITVFVVSMAITMAAVVKNADKTQEYSRMREQSRFTSDITTDIYHHLAAQAGVIGLPEAPEATAWPQYALDDIDSQIRLAGDEHERAHWRRVHHAVTLLAPKDGRPPTRDEVVDAVATARVNLRALRMHFGQAEAESIAEVAASSLRAEVAIGAAAALMILLFLVYVIMVRDSLVRPIEVIKASADIIGDGRLDHRVPLSGTDELAELAKRLDAMAASLAKHQAELIAARELSAIGSLCTNVAHGLRNPLAAIRASAQLAERRTTSGPARQMIRDLVKQADRMDQRITKMFRFSQPLELRRDCVVFAELARAAHAHARPLLDARHVTLVTEDNTGDALWCLDHEQLAEAVAELLTNAAYHSDKGDQIILRGSGAVAAGTGEASGNGHAAGERHGGRLTLQVIDVGTGMPQPTLDKAFDMFFTGRPNGSGMGLGLVRRIVEKHDGSITIESQVGQGTTVTIVLGHACPHGTAAGAPNECQVKSRTRALREADLRIA